MFKLHADAVHAHAFKDPYTAHAAFSRLRHALAVETDLPARLAEALETGDHACALTLARIPAAGEGGYPLAAAIARGWEEVALALAENPLARTMPEEADDYYAEYGTYFAHGYGPCAAMLAADAGMDDVTAALFRRLGCNPVYDQEGTLFSVAARKGLVRTVRAMLAADVWDDDPCSAEDSPVHAAANAGQLDILAVILEARPDAVNLAVEGDDIDRVLPVEAAAAGGQIAAMQVLLDHPRAQAPRWGEIIEHAFWSRCPGVVAFVSPHFDAARDSETVLYAAGRDAGMLACAAALGLDPDAAGRHLANHLKFRRYNAARALVPVANVHARNRHYGAPATWAADPAVPVDIREQLTVNMFLC